MHADVQVKMRWPGRGWWPRVVILIVVLVVVRVAPGEALPACLLGWLAITTGGQRVRMLGDAR